MKKLNKRRIRKIILEETINAVSLVQEAMKQPNLAMFGKGDLDKTRDMYVSTPRGPKPNHPFYTGDYNPAGKPVGYDYDAPDEDPAELGRYDGLNNNKDTTLYRDNPDYKLGYDEVSIDVDTKHSEVPAPPDELYTGDDENTPEYEGLIREAKKKKKNKDSNSDEQEGTSGKYWYLGTLDKDHEPCMDWTKFGFAPVDKEEE